MRLLKQLLTPAGALAMLIGFWLPWADVTCGQVRTEPDFWQLARTDERMYLYCIPIVVLGVCGVLAWRGQRRKLALTSAAGAITAVGMWCYLLLKKDEVAEYQAKMVEGSNALTRLFQDLDVALGMGFKLYLAGALIALAGAALQLAGDEAKSPPGT